MNFRAVARTKVLVGEPPRWLWLWLPLLVQLVQRIAFLRDYTAFDLLYAESGAIEILTAVALAAGVVAGISVLRHRTPLPLRAWLFFVTLGCFYACGEELNWGQLIFGWETPAWLAAINGLGEFNLHEVSYPWFSLAPRTFLWLFVLAGIIHITLLRRGVEKGWALFWPTPICLPSALLAILMREPEILLWLGVDPTLQPGFYWGGWIELEEPYLAMFLFLYLLAIWYRLGRRAASVGRDENGIGQPGGGRPRRYRS